jgi:uncharacterized protein
MTERIGDWMQTRSGGRFYPIDPQPGDINIEDIAHALSMQCRYGGHIDRFYSVAEHCVLMSEAVPQEYALEALMHDATEAYVVDVPRPVKRYLPEYRVIEDNVWAVLGAKFGFPPRMSAAVKEADNRILVNEKRALFAKAEYWPGTDELEPLRWDDGEDVTIFAASPETAEAAYLYRFKELTGGL